MASRIQRSVNRFNEKELTRESENHEITITVGTNGFYLGPGYEWPQSYL